MTVDEVAQWDSVPTGYEADMVADGIALESAPDMAARMAASLVEREGGGALAPTGHRYPNLYNRGSI